VSEAGAECHECPVDNQANSDQSGCEPCGPGTYFDKDYKRCVGCPQAKMCPNGKIEDCPVGTFNNSWGSTGC